MGGSSYINGVVLRQRDANSGWTSAGDGTLEERRYYCQNWRGDFAAMLTSGGAMVEWAKFSAYGVPFGIPAADINSSGGTTSGEVTTIQTWTSAYDVRADLDLDGDVDSTDGTLASSYSGDSRGWDVLSVSSVANRVSYAGYRKDYNLDINHVRNRVYSPELGRWMRRDPLGYVDGMGLYAYAYSAPATTTDFLGLASGRCGISAVCAWPPVPTVPKWIAQTPWDCAARSKSYKECYACCNRNPGDWKFQKPCYAYCNIRFRPPGDWPPFLPSLGPNGPCFRESDGHPACTRVCTFSGETDAIMTMWVTPDGETVRICCLCNDSFPPVRDCPSIAECAVERMVCFAFTDPTVPEPCRNVACLGKQLQCLHGKLDTAEGACRQQLLDQIQYFEELLDTEEEECARQQR